MRTARFQVVPDCTCDATADDGRHRPACAVTGIGLDASPAPTPTPDQVETLAKAVLALHSRFLAPHGKRHLINAAQREMIRQAVRYAEAVLHDDED